MKPIRLALFLLFFVWRLSAAENVLLVTIDTWRADRFGLFDTGHVKTPQLDALARRGTTFRYAFTHAPLTLPAHATLLTGTVPPFHGVEDNNGFRLDDKFQTLAEYLGGRGYDTAAFVGSFVLSRIFGLAQGFTVYEEPPQDEIRAAEGVGRFLGWLEGRKGKKWFAWLHLWDPHTPYAPPPPYDREYGADPYSGEVAYVDAQLGRVWAALQAKGLLDDTCIVISGDHGESLGEHGEYEHGYFAYNSTLHVPLIVCAPGVKARIDNTYVSLVDVFPTVCDLIGLPRPGQLQGASLLPLLQGKSRPERPIYFEARMAYHSKGWAPLQGIIDRHDKFIDLPIPEAYRLDEDFQEKHNVVSRIRLNEWRGKLQQVIGGLSGTERGSSQAQWGREINQRLRTFGYLSGFKQEKKAKYTREDDLKVLLPIQNLLRDAEELVKTGSTQAAEQKFREAIRRKPELVAAYIRLAEMLRDLHRAPEAVESLRVGLKAVPGNVELQSFLGVVLSEIPDDAALNEAVTLLRAITAREERNAEAWNHLGVAYFRKKQAVPARQAFETAVRLDPEYAMAYQNLGTLYLALYTANKKPEFRVRAIEQFNAALRRDPELVSALNGRAAAARLGGENEAAIRDWRRCMAIDPCFVDACFNLAVTLLESGRRREARECLSALQARCRERLSQAEQARLKRMLAEAVE